MPYHMITLFFFSFPFGIALHMTITVSYTLITSATLDNNFMVFFIPLKYWKYYKWIMHYKVSNNSIKFSYYESNFLLIIHFVKKWKKKIKVKISFLSFFFFFLRKILSLKFSSNSFLKKSIFIFKLIRSIQIRNLVYS